MIIAKNDEEKRTKVYQTSTLVSTILIIVIAIYFLTKLFTVNPLKGKWVDEDGSINISIESNGTLVAEIPDIAEETNVKVEMKYTLDKDAKTISITMDEGEIQEIAEKSDGQYTPEMLENAVSMIASTFDYSVESGELILTEREYGEQMIFLEK